MALSETAKLIAELGFKDKLTPGVDTALKSVNKLDKGLSRVGKGAGQLSAGVARAGTIIGTAAVAGLGAAAKAAIDWEDAFAGVVKTVDEADLNKAGLTFRDIELSLRKMSTTMPVAAADLARIAEAGGAMGIAGKDIEEFTRVVALIGSTTNIATDEAAVALGQMQNVIGLTAAEFDNFAAALVDLGNKGNSTEAQILEIARRSGGAAKLIGIAKEATLGWAAAAANLGLNEELAGTAVQRFFITTQTAITEGGGDLKTLAKISGQTTEQFKKNFNENASAALEDFLVGLSKMTKDQRITAIQDVFGKGAGLTRLLVGLSDSVDQNLTPSLNTSAEAWEKNTAATAEFEKRNATVRSGFIRLKNSVLDAAITVGEGFAPALGRAASKLSEFLAQDVNRSALKSIGEDIGKSIDAIDWQQVLAGARTFTTLMKTALSYAKLLLDAVMALPTEVKAAGLGLIGLNKLSGGLVGAGVGNIIGGLGETLAKSLAARIPVFGKAFVQPVFVTNMGAGGLGGAAGAAGSAGWAASLKGFALALGPAVAAALVSSEVTTATNKGLGTNFASPLAGGIGGNIVTGLHNLGEILKLFNDRNKPKPAPVVPKPTTHTPTSSEARAGMPEVRQWHFDRDNKTTRAVENLKRDIGPSLSQTPVKLDAVQRAGVEAGLAAKNAGIETKTAATSAGIAAALASKNAGDRAYGGSLTAASIIAATIRANRPIINVDSRQIIDARTYNSAVNRETTYINGGYNGGAPQGGR